MVVPVGTSAGVGSSTGASAFLAGAFFAGAFLAGAFTGSAEVPAASVLDCEGASESDGAVLAAPEAASAGLIYRAVPDDEFAAEVDRVVDRLARGASVAYRLTKQAIAAATLPHLDDALDRERDLQVQLFDTSDFAEGTTAFLAKRPPVFEGR